MSGSIDLLWALRALILRGESNDNHRLRLVHKLRIEKMLDGKHFMIQWIQFLFTRLPPAAADPQGIEP